MTTIAVVIPTTPGREAELERCLQGLSAQRRPPDELCVVRGRSGPVEALTAGWARTTAEWIAVVDDDAIAEDDWLLVLSGHLGDPRLGAVGGRIVNVIDGTSTARPYAGGSAATLSYYGRTRSRLHDEPARHLVCDAAFLPGSNMCFRREALPAIDPALAVGMAPSFELALCLEVRGRGYRVRFDSAAVVTHRPAPRPAHADRRDRARAAGEYSEVLTYALLRWLPWPRRLAFGAYFTLVGQRLAPGLVRAPGFVLRRDSRRLLARSWVGRRRGLTTALAHRNPGPPARTTSQEAA